MKTIMNYRSIFFTAFTGIALILMASCSTADPTATATNATAAPATAAPATAVAPAATNAPPTPTTQAPNQYSPTTATATPTPEPVKTATLYVFSNASPHITEINAETNEILRTADIPDLVKFAWNDDGNYFDGKDLWLTARNPAEKTSELIFLNVESLTVTDRLALGSNPANVYLGGGESRKGIIYVGLQGNMDQEGEIVAVDAKTREIVDRIALDGGQIACDMDIAIGPDGVERIYTPNQKMDSVQNFDAGSHTLLNTVAQPTGSTPFMLTASPDGRHIWVQDGGAGTNTVLDAVTLATVTRIPTGEGPVVASFSPDGKYGYVGHYKATQVTVIDTSTFEIIKKVEVGASPGKLAAHPNGKFAYAAISKENKVAVIDTATWTVVDNILLEGSPGGMYLLSS